MPATTSTARPGTLEVPDATLYYEVRGAGPLVVLVGAPMNADAFAPLADRLAAAYTVLTTDPRGVHRSRLADPEADSQPEQRADDLARLISHVGAGPAAVFGSSGGAVTALALAQAHPDLAHTVIAHEPPLIELLEDRDALRAATEDYCATYLAGDVLGAWRKFFRTADIAMPDEVLVQMFGGDRDARSVADERFWFAHELRPSTSWRPDTDLLRGGASRIVVGVGDDSAGELCDRTSRALAAALGREPARFPGGHIAFVDDPDAFLAPLRRVLPGHPSPDATGSAAAGSRRRRIRPHGLTTDSVSATSSKVGDTVGG